MALRQNRDARRTPPLEQDTRMVDTSTWDSWEQRDRDDYCRMAELNILHAFRSPDEELTSKKG